MKKLLFLKFLFVLLLVGQFNSLNAQSEYKYTYVDPIANELTITNIGDMAGDIGSFWLCLGPGTYQQISSIAAGSTSLAPGMTITLPYIMDEVNDGLSLFSTNIFGSSDPAILLDYVQWGAANQPRVGQAVTAGRWDDAASFVSGQAPYTTTTGGSAAAWMSTCLAMAGDITFDIAANPSIEISPDMLTATICMDGQADPLAVNVAAGSVGSNSGWIITDNATGEILATPTAGPFDLDGAGPGTCNIYYIRYEDGLSGNTLGENIADLSGCFDLSNSVAVIRLSAADGQCNLPDLLSTVPVANSTNVSLDSTIALTFSDTVLSSLVNNQNIVVLSEQTGLVAGTFSGGGTTTVTFTPVADFLPGDLISVTVTDKVASSMEVFQFTTVSGAVPLAIKLIENIVDTNSLSPLGAAVGDLDGDNDLDFAVASRNDDTVAWYENDGANPPSFTKRIVTSTADGAGSVTLGDVDNDGDMDIFATSQIDNSVRVFSNDGNSIPSFTEAFVATISGAQNVTVGDVNGDGKLDFVVAGIIGNVIRYYQNNGVTPLSFDVSDVNTELAAAPQSIALGDLDNDGNLDIMAALFGSGEVVWYQNNGDIAPSFTRNDIINGFANAISVRPGDFDGDGDLDIVAASLGSGTVSWLENNGMSNPSFSQQIISTSVASSRRLSVGDIEGDGDLDVFATSNTNDQFILFENNGNADPTFSETIIMGTTTAAQISRLGDIDGDGDLDVLFTAAGANTVSWFETVTCNVNAGDITFVDTPNNTVLISDDMLTATICRDGEADPLTVDVAAGSVGSNSGWIITDAATGEILGTPASGPFDLDGAGPGICNLYYIRYEDGLSGNTIGENIAGLIGCFDLSNPLTVIRAEPNAGTLDIDETTTTNANSSTAVSGTTATICIDNDAAPVYVTKTGYEMNLSYRYVITDESDMILAITDANAIDLTGAGLGTCRIWGWSYRGVANNGADFVGSPLADLDAANCSDISDNFVTVVRVSPEAGTLDIDATATTNANSSTAVSGTTATICIDNDAAPVYVTKTGYEMNLSYRYVITDESDMILAITDASAIDLTGAGVGTCRIWGWSYRGVANNGADFIGSPLADLDAANCSDISDNFVTVVRVSPEAGTLDIDETATTNANSSTAVSGTTATICIDNDAAPVYVTKTGYEMNLSYRYVITDESDMILAITDASAIDLTGAGVGTCRIWGWSYRGVANNGADFVGGPLADLDAANCSDISDNFVTVVRVSPEAGTVSIDVDETNNINSAVLIEGDQGTICVDNGASPIAVTKTNYETNLSYRYVITDESDMILAITDASAIDLTGAGVGTCRIWGWSYRGVANNGADFVGGPLTDLDAANCSDISDNFVTVVRVSGSDCDSLSLNEFEESINLTVFPNPTKDILNIRFNSNTQLSDITIEIYNISGQRVFRNVSEYSQNITVDLRSLNSGLYLINIIDNARGLTITKKVAKQ